MIDIDRLQAAIADEASELELVAYKDAGLALGHEFGLSSSVDWRREKPLKVKRQKGLFLLSRAIHGSLTYERSERLSKLEAVVKTFETEAGLCGLGELLRVCRETDEAMTEHSDGSRVPSNTRVKTKTGVMAVFYKDKMIIHLTPELFEGLVGFVRNYAPTEYLCQLDLV